MRADRIVTMAVGLDVGAQAGASDEEAKLANAKLGEKLVTFARDFNAAGGVLTLDDWASMSPETRHAFVRAAYEVKKHHTEMLASLTAQALINLQQKAALEAARGLVVPPSVAAQMAAQREAESTPRIVEGG